MVNTRRTFILILFAALIVTISTAGNAASVFDSSFSISYMVPDTWKEAPSFDSDINPAFVRKAYTVDGVALFLVTGQDAGSAFSADSWLSAMEQSYKTEPSISVDARAIQSFGGKQTATLRAYSETGTGTRLTGGSIPTTRLVALIPRGTSIIQFILTCPSVSFDALAEEMKKVVVDAEFRTTPVVISSSNTKDKEAASTTTKPVVLPAKITDTPISVKPVQTAPGIPAPSVSGQLTKVGLHVYEGTGTNAPYDFVLMSPKAYKAYRTVAITAVSGGYADDQMVWRLPRTEYKDMVILIKPSKWVGWLLPAAVFNQYAVVEGNDLVLSMNRRLPNGTTVAQQLKRYINPLEAFKGETQR